MTQQEWAENIIAMAPTLYHVCYGILRNPQDREDAVQNAIEKAWRKGGSLRDEKNFKPWVVRILMHECYSLLRKKKDDALLDALPNEPKAPMDEEARALREAILNLPDKLRLPVVLHYMEGFATAETAQILRLPKGTVLTRLRAARAQLKDLLSEEDEQ